MNQRNQFVIAKAKRHLLKAKNIVRKSKTRAPLKPSLPLPIEIINEILQKLPIREQQKSRMVSKQFRDALAAIKLSHDCEKELCNQIEKIIFESLKWMLYSIYKYNITNKREQYNKI